MPVVEMGPRYRERAALQSEYMQREFRVGNEDTKQLQRARVLSHIQKFHTGSNLRFFSFPGAWWACENFFVPHFSIDTYFIAIEKHYEIMRHGATFMPGGMPTRGFIPINDCDLLLLENDRSRIMWCDGSTFVGLERTDFVNKHAYRNFVRQMCGWTAAWWDFTAATGDDTLLCLRKTEDFLAHRIEQAPVSITLLGAREAKPISKAIKNIADPNQGSADRRAAFLERYHNEVSEKFSMRVEGVFPYMSSGGAPMILINSVFNRVR